MNYRKRVDANQAQVVETLRKCGWYVHDTSRLGGGFPDLVAAKNGRLVLIEVKDGAKPLSAQALTPAEANLRNLLAAHRVSVQLVRSVEDALAL